MDLIIKQYINNVPLFLLILARITGLFIMSPIFGRKNVPFYWKINLAIFLSYIVIMTDSTDTYIEIINVFQFLIYIIKELSIGILIGYITTVAFSTILMAGQLIDTQIGFSMVNVLDPHSNTQVPLFGNFNNILALLLFFIIDGHHTLIKLIFDSFSLIPIGNFELKSDIYILILEYFKSSFLLAFKLAIPVIGAALLAEIALGLMSRSIPQMNIFAIGMPLKVIIGLVILFLFYPVYMGVVKGSFSSMFTAIRTIIGELIPQ